MSSIAIRPACADDYEAIARIWLQGWLSPLDGVPVVPPDNLFETLRARIPREVEAGWELSAACMGARVVGMLALKPADKCLDQIFVDEILRSQGIGKELLDHVKSRLADGFWLRTHSRNLKAQRFYKREGMIHLRDEPHPRHPETLFSLFEWTPD